MLQDAISGEILEKLQDV